MDQKQDKRGGRRRWGRRLAAGALLLVAALCAWRLAAYAWSSHRAENRFTVLSRQVHAPEAHPETGELPQEGEAPPSPLEALRQENGDLVGWITVPGTRIDYPVMHTPEDPQHYLRRDFDGAYSLAGTPFLDGRCTLSSDNLILWGHNMKAGTMFAGLLDFQDAAYAEEHACMTLITPGGTRSYEVAAAFRTEVDEEGDYFRWYDCLDFPDEAAFDAFAAGLRSSSLIPVPSDLAFGDTFLTLATCSYHDQNGRFVVVGRNMSQAD